MHFGPKPKTHIIRADNLFRGIKSGQPSDCIQSAPLANPSSERRELAIICCGATTSSFRFFDPCGALNRETPHSAVAPSFSIKGTIANQQLALIPYDPQMCNLFLFARRCQTLHGRNSWKQAKHPETSTPNGLETRAGRAQWVSSPSP